MMWRTRTTPTTCESDQPIEQSALQSYFLERLTRMGEIRRERAASLAPDQARLLAHALYSTYWDCVDLGLRDAARSVLGISGSQTQ